MQADPPLPVVFAKSEALRMGLSPAQVRTRITGGRWHDLRRGVYCREADWQKASPAQRHTLQAAAVALLRRSEANYAFSHVTAAALFGLPVRNVALDRVHLTVDTGTGASTRHQEDICQHVARLTDDEVTTIRGLRTTSAPRTVTDCLRHLAAPDSVAVADAALHARFASIEDVRHTLARQSGWPYAGVAALALPLVDGRRESSLESRSAVVMHQCQLPPALPQVKIYDQSGRFVARVDFAWLDKGVVGEADGRAKYLADGDPVAAFDAEKERQRRLEALGLVVVRWGWRHLEGNPPPLVERLREALARGDAARFTGRAA